MIKNTSFIVKVYILIPRARDCYIVLIILVIE